MKDSLKNLQLDYIDLLIVHKNDPNCPLEGKNLKRDKMLSGWKQEMLAPAPHIYTSTFAEIFLHFTFYKTKDLKLLLFIDKLY